MCRGYLPNCDGSESEGENRGGGCFLLWSGDRAGDGPTAQRSTEVGNTQRRIGDASGRSAGRFALPQGIRAPRQKAQINTIVYGRTREIVRNDKRKTRVPLR